MLQYSFSWKQLSVIAGLSYWRFYFRLFNGSIRSPQIVEFFKALHLSDRTGRGLITGVFHQMYLAASRFNAS